MRCRFALPVTFQSTFQFAAFALLALLLSTAFVSRASAQVPTAPTSVSATPRSTQVILGWTAPTGATSYNLYRSTTSGGEGTTAYKTGIATAYYVDTAVTNSSAYYYKVAAVNSSGTGPQSSEVTATPLTDQATRRSTRAALWPSTPKTA